MGESKKVGVIVPIYNAEKYLRECLDSVFNQTYKDLEVFLVDDGSTDSSLEIAKKYVEKDSRFTLCAKENGGQSSARNVGIEFLSNEYTVCRDTKSVSLHSFRIVGRNPYKINFIYSLKETLEIPQIDYLIFLDSDDFWDVDCIRKCVEKMEDAEIVWFDFEKIYEGDLGYQSARKPTTLQKYGFHQECKISPIEIFQKSSEIERKWCAYTWQGMIDFKFLKTNHLKFLSVPLEEDHHFWLLLFVLSQSVFILPQKLYIYRIHSHSVTNYGGKSGIKNIPKPFQRYLKNFYGNPMLLHKYCRAGSAAMMLADIFDRLESRRLETQMSFVLKQSILRNLMSLAMNLESFQVDPMGFLPFLEKIKPYIKEQKIGAYALMHQCLEYQLGLAILSSFKNVPNFLRSFGAIYAALKKYERLENIESKVSLCDYWDFEESKYLKRHLSFRIGRGLVNIVKVLKG